MKTSESTETLRVARRPDVVNMSPAVLRQMEQRVQVAIERGATPGAVLLVAKDGQIVKFRAYGNRQTDPDVPMTLDTLFDLASVSKTVGTATATMLLLEDGKLRLDDKVAAFIPAFAANGKGDVTIRDLLTHRSGLKDYMDVNKVRANVLSPIPSDNLIENIAALPKLYPTGEYTVYSCLNYFTLARINEIVAGESQEALLRKRIWKPLGMSDTGYTLTEEQKKRLAPTFRSAAWKPGMIHDPLANYHGVSSAHCPGNAGLFSSARDLAIFCQMILNGGTYGGVRVMKAATVREMTAPQSTLPEFDVKKNGPGPLQRRGFGWIVYREEPYISSAAPDGSFIGHTGYAGTYLWVDKCQKAFIVLLTNAVYDHDPPQIQEYRKEITRDYLEGLYGSQ